MEPVSGPHVHMNGRVYDPSLGRFLSVDPVFEFPTNTQSLNPYSYVLNNPLSMTDPTGYMATCSGDTKDGQQCDLGKVKSSDVESIQKTKSGQYVVNTKDGGSYTVDSASKTVSTGQGGSVTLTSTFNGNGYTNTLSVNSAQNKPTDTASINSPASLSKDQSSGQNSGSGTASLGNTDGSASSGKDTKPYQYGVGPFDLVLLNKNRDPDTWKDAMTYMRTDKTKNYYIVIGHGDLLEGRFVLNAHNEPVYAEELAKIIMNDPNFTSNPRPIMLMICMGGEGYQSLARELTRDLRREDHIDEPVSGPTNVGLVGKGVYNVGHDGVQQWYDPNGDRTTAPP